MKQMIDMDECVINALQLFTKTKIPKIDLGTYKKLLVIGSVNAYFTGKILFEDIGGIVCDEGSYQKVLKNNKDIDKAVIISASGKKHSINIAKDLKRRKVHTILLTNNPTAPAGEYVNQTILLPKNVEPYTYNTSTYMGMMLSKTNEKPGQILEFINKEIKPKIPKDLKKYNAYIILIPSKVSNTRELFLTKFDELFGPKINGRVFSHEQVKHAKTIVESDKELVISFGKVNNFYGTKRLNLPLPKNAGPATMMAIAYYVIGSIQKQNPPYFKNNLVNYTKKISKIFNQELKPIVE